MIGWGGCISLNRAEAHIFCATQRHRLEKINRPNGLCYRTNGPVRGLLLGGASIGATMRRW